LARTGRGRCLSFTVEAGGARCTFRFIRLRQNSNNVQKQSGLRVNPYLSRQTGDAWIAQNGDALGQRSTMDAAGEHLGQHLNVRRVERFLSYSSPRRPICCTRLRSISACRIGASGLGDATFAKGRSPGGVNFSSAAPESKARSGATIIARSNHRIS
jgi:hypothetical protein